MPTNNCYMNSVFTILLISYGVILTNQLINTQKQANLINSIYTSHKHLEEDIYNSLYATKHSDNADFQLKLDKQQLTIDTILFNHKQIEERIEKFKQFIVIFNKHLEKQMNEYHFKNMTFENDIATRLVNLKNDIDYINSRINLLESDNKKMYKY